MAEELKSHEETIASLEDKMEEGEERKGEELAKCAGIIEELKQRLSESERQKDQQLLKVKVVTPTSCFI